MKYTTVAEMTTQVNEMLEHLDAAKRIAKALADENDQNAFFIKRDAIEAISEVRPLNKEQRLREAIKQCTMFERVKELTATSIDMIGWIY